jgi:hypothetical protein
MSGPIERRLEAYSAELVAGAIAQIGESQAELQTALSETVGAVLLRGARYVSINSKSAASGGDLMLAHSSGRLTGVSLVETGGVQPITLVLHDGSDPSAPVVGAWKLAAGGAQTGTLALQGGVFFGQGLYMELIGTGVLLGAVYLGGSD